ncbi:MAG: colanic acid biosynthesis glycosyltransferase WcaI, partial [Gammaproteobacteria bacterium]|nr:colanic acid biosynthesis glycosyltransferase WcaI [Gammaproteobacteria bacterium]
MKIIIYSINYYPELIGIGKYNGEMAEWLADKGHEVSVITAPPYYPAWVVKSGYSRFWFKKEKLNQVNVIRCPLWVPSKPSGLKRILHLFSFAFTSFPVIFWYAIRHRPEIIFVVEPPIFC